MDILRFTTAGSVDDGKSTLIGRLLYDTNNVKSDILHAITDTRRENNINLAHLTDGLRTEREQGITIDIAYKYFTTPVRKYIITDAPGHFQFTKNLVTGASGVDLIIILVDVVNGITEQTLRHSLVASFLRIKHVVVAVNKMDLINYDETIYRKIENEYRAIALKLKLEQVAFIPVSALQGDNVSFQSDKMRWYTGKTLQQYLADWQPSAPGEGTLRLSVQYVPGNDQLYAGKVLSGTVKRNDAVTIFPGMHITTVEKIFFGFDEVENAGAGQNISFSLAGGHRPGRGAVIAGVENLPVCYRSFSAGICWLDTTPLVTGKEYLLRMHAAEVPCTITNVLHKTDPGTFENIIDERPVAVNEFAHVRIETREAIVSDTLVPALCRGILIDPVTNYTSGAFIL